MRMLLGAALAAAVALALPAAAQVNSSVPVVIDLSGSGRAMQSNTGVSVRCPDDTVCRTIIEGYGNTDPIITLQAGGGSAAAPTPPPVNSLLGSINFRGYDGSPWDGVSADRKGFSYGAVQFRAVAAESWDLTHHGAYAILSTTPKANGITNGNQDLVTQTWWDDGTISFNRYPYGQNLQVGLLGKIEATPSSRALGGFLGFGPAVDYVIASGAVSVSGSRVRVDTTGGAGDLVRINASGAQDGDIVIVQIKDSAHVVTARDQGSGGNLQLASDFVMANPSYKLVLIYQSSNNCWIELSRSNNG